MKFAYRPKTWQAYKAMFLVYMSFCDFLQTPFHQPSIFTLLAFIECLAFNDLKPASINNYISAIKSKFQWFSLDLQVFQHPALHHMLKAIERSISITPILKGVFQISHLETIVKLCSLFENELCFKAIYTLAFFSFMRLSNLVPESLSKFDIKKHLCRGDILFEPTHAIVIVKWSKTIQTQSKGTYIIIPKLGQNILCPVTALHTMIQAFQAPSNAPLFTSKLGILTQSKVRTHLKKVLAHMNLPPASFSFHTFRRSGATFAFNSQVDLHSIKRHGTWSSDAVHSYIIQDPVNAATVSQTFQRLLST